MKAALLTLALATLATAQVPWPTMTVTPVPVPTFTTTPGIPIPWPTRTITPRPTQTPPPSIEPPPAETPPAPTTPTPPALTPPALAPAPADAMPPPPAAEPQAATPPPPQGDSPPPQQGTNPPPPDSSQSPPPPGQNPSPPSPGRAPDSGSVIAFIPSPGSNKPTGLESAESFSVSNGPTLLRGVSELDILKLANALHCLSTNYYTCAADGSPAPGTGTPEGCKRASLSEKLSGYSREIGKSRHKQMALIHRALKQAGGDTNCPATSLGNSFKTLFSQAYGGNAPITFDPYANNYNFLIGASVVSNNAVNKETLALLGFARQQSVGLVRAAVLESLPLQLPGTNQTIEQVVQAVAKYVNSLAGGTLIRPLSPTQLSNLEDEGFPPRALPSASWDVATLGTNTRGGFFP